MKDIIFAIVFIVLHAYCQAQNFIPISITNTSSTEKKDQGFSTELDTLSITWRTSSEEFLSKKDEQTRTQLDQIERKIIENVSNYEELEKLKFAQDEVLNGRNEYYKEYRRLKATADMLEFKSNESEIDNLLLGARMNARLFKVRNATHAQMYFEGSADDGKSKYLKNSLFSFGTNGKKASLFNELYSDYLGPFRLHFGALITGDIGSDAVADENEKIDDAVQRLIGGGGNVVFGITYPMFDLSTLHKTFTSKIHISPKIGFDLPELGQTIEESTNNIDLALEGSFFLKGLNDIISIYGGFRYGYLMGSKSFEKNLGIDQNFWLGQFTIGLALNSAFRISYSRNFSSLDNSILDLNNTISFVIVPN